MVAFLQQKTQPLAYDELAGVIAGSEEIVLAYVSQSEQWISLIACSGRIYAEFSLYINDEKIGMRRSGPERNADFEFTSPLFLDNGAVLKVKVRHYHADQIGVFEASVFGHTSQYALT